jgi:hypothetical protein
MSEFVEKIRNLQVALESCPNEQTRENLLKTKSEYL